VSLFKRCGCPEGDCGHPWYYSFRVNRRRYKATTETALKRQALDIEARERSRILEGRHGIRRQPDVTFAEFARTYLADHARLHKRDEGRRDSEIIAMLNKTLGAVLLREISAHRIETWKRERLSGRWRAHGQTG
jgi:hypothetical protein